MLTGSTVGAPVTELLEELSDLQLAADDLDVVAGMLPEQGPQGVSCGGGYCLRDYCASGYSSK